MALGQPQTAILAGGCLAGFEISAGGFLRRDFFVFLLSSVTERAKKRELPKLDKKSPTSGGKCASNMANP